MYDNAIINIEHKLDFELTRRSQYRPHGSAVLCLSFLVFGRKLAAIYCFVLFEALCVEAVDEHMFSVSYDSWPNLSNIPGIILLKNHAFAFVFYIISC